MEEYFELDKTAEGNFEYINGEIFEISGVSPNHAIIEMNLAEIVSPAARKKGCRAFPANLRIKVPASPTYRYPDMSVVCGEAVFEEIGGLECLVNPVLIVKVLSESYDQGEKFRLYKSVESFREYLLVSQGEKIITHYLKHNDRFWLQSDYFAGETVHITSLDFDLDVEEVYQGVSFANE